MSDTNGQGGAGPVGVEPTPFTITMHPGSDRQTMMVVIHTVLGQMHFWMSNEEASAMGRAMIQAASGLVLPEANKRFTPPS